MTKPAGCCPAGLAVALLPALLLQGAPVWSAEGGRELYATNCAICHLADGSGAAGLAPPLRNPLWQRLGDRAADYMAGVMISGLVGVPLDGARYAAAMPPWSQLSDAQLAAIGSYVLQELNGESTDVTAAVVEQAREKGPSYATLATLRDGGG